jgi:hypothetical protein
MSSWTMTRTITYKVNYDRRFSPGPNGFFGVSDNTTVPRLMQELTAREIEQFVVNLAVELQVNRSERLLLPTKTLYLLVSSVNNELCSSGQAHRR